MLIGGTREVFLASNRLRHDISHIQKRLFLPLPTYILTAIERPT